MLIDFLDRHFITLFLIAGFSIKLWVQRNATDKSLGRYWLTVISTLLLIAADTMELWACGSPRLRLWRILFSVIGYVMRPTAALSIALIVYPPNHKPRLLWIPWAANLLIYGSAFFTTIAFGYGPDYKFIRGPLGYTVIYVSFFYIAFAVWMMVRRFRDKDHARERVILYLCAASCVIATWIDMNTESSSLNAAIMVSGVFLFMFLRSIDSNRDALTRLLNRSSFFEDSVRYGASISAVGSVDMNGLKQLNDVMGHEAGDEALRVIGRSMEEISNRNVFAYRIGGDEFALLFIRQTENTVHQAMEQLEGMVRAKGYSVSSGYAMRGGKYASVQDLIRWADENMYAKKAQYYSENRHDRRKRTASAEEKKEEESV